MPTVPRIPQIEGRMSPEQGVETYVRSSDADAVGGIAAKQGQQLARANTEMGQVMVEIGARMNEAEDAQRVLDADTAMNNYVAAAQREVEALEGENARGATEKAAGKAAETRNKIAEKLTPRQRLAFLNRSDATMVAFTDRVARHEQKQNVVALNNATQANIGSAIEAAASEKDNDRRMVATVKALDTIKQGAAVLKKQNGWDDKTTEQWTLANTTKLHVEIIENLTNDADPKLAQSYYNLNKKQIAATQWDKIEKGLKVSMAKSTGMELVDSKQDIIANVPADQVLQAANSVREQIRAATKDNPEAREYAERELDRRVHQRLQLDHAEQKAADDAGWKAYAAGGITAIPPTVWAGMSGQLQSAMKEKAAQDSRRAAADSRREEKIHDDPETVLAMSALLGTPAGVEEFKGVDLRRYIGKLTTPTLAKLAAKQAELKQNPENAQRAMTNQQFINKTANDLKLNKTERATFEKTTTDALADALQEKQRTKGAKAQLNDQEVRDVITQTTIQGVRKRAAWFGADERAYELRTEADIDKWEPSSQGIMRIREILERQGDTKAMDRSAAHVTKVYRDYLKMRLKTRSE